MRECFPCLIYIISTIVFVGCVRQESLTKEDVIYANSTKLRELTKVPFPKVTFVDGTETRYAGGNRKEYKLIIASSEGKTSLLEKIKEELLNRNRNWTQSDTTFSFSSHSTHYDITNKGIGNTTLMVTITVPMSSNDTIYIEERMMNNTPEKNIE